MPLNRSGLKSQRLRDANATTLQMLALYKSQRFSATKTNTPTNNNSSCNNNNDTYINVRPKEQRTGQLQQYQRTTTTAIENKNKNHLSPRSSVRPPPPNPPPSPLFSWPLSILLSPSSFFCFNLCWMLLLILVAFSSCPTFKPKPSKAKRSQQHQQKSQKQTEHRPPPINSYKWVFRWKSQIPRFSKTPILKPQIF